MKKILIIFVVAVLTSCSGHREGQHEHTIWCGEDCNYEHEE